MWLNTPPVFFFRQRQARHDKRQKAEAARAHHGVPKLPGVTELSVCDPPQGRLWPTRRKRAAATVERKLRPCRRSVNCPRTQQERLHKNGEGPIKNVYKQHTQDKHKHKHKYRHQHHGGDECLCLPWCREQSARCTSSWQACYLGTHRRNVAGPPLASPPETPPRKPPSPRKTPARIQYTCMCVTYGHERENSACIERRSR